jgi:asparagine synthase (glutamine-hydrolysing)
VCGIAAIFKRRDLPRPLSLVDAMAAVADHRGPDGGAAVGFDVDTVVRSPASTAWQSALGHRRLSIVDLSAAAAQPMAHGDRYWLTYNGEVYNHPELRAELRRLGHVFRTHSDTEVLLAAFAEWGPRCFERMRGMWACVLVDTARGTALLCRDRLGMKPLYTWRSDGMVAVVSEIKQLLAVPGFRARRSGTAIAEYLATGYQAAGRSFFEGVEPVPAGTYVTISTTDLTMTHPEPYWHPERVTVSIGTADEAGEAFARKLAECVRLHMRSDVPVGCSLSGGLDSSAVAVLAGTHLGAPDRLPTFSSTFGGEPLDEQECRDAVVAHVRADRHLVEIRPEGFLADLHHFVWHHDEPVSSFSLFAAYCVARGARDAGVPVLLSGQGGDEVLSGYWQSYFLYLRELALSGRVVKVAEHVGGALLPGGNASMVAEAPAILHRYLARRRGLGSGPDGSHAAGGLLRESLDGRGQLRRVHEIRSMYLPRLLKWDDRNAMAFSVEGRYPFLDHELVELCLSFAPEVLHHRGWTKWPLRRGLDTRLPRRVARRRSKFGFWVPQDEWLCGPLRPTVAAWLDADRPLWDVIPRETVRVLAERTWGAAGRRPEPGQALTRCFMLDQWLEVFDVA